MPAPRKDLVPTRIIDKNGKRTTVHKKSVGKNRATGSAAVAPASRVASVPSPPTPAAGLSGLATVGDMGRTEPALVWEWDGVKREWSNLENGKRIVAGSSLRATVSTLNAVTLDTVRSVTLIPGWNSDGERAIHPDTGTEWDLDGFDAEGFDADGFDRRGFSVEGVHRTGGEYDPEGFNAADIDRYGYNRHGYGIDGFDRDGFHKEGYDRNRVMRDGFHYDTGKNADGLTRDEAARAAEHGIDADLMRAFIDGD